MDLTHINEFEKFLKQEVKEATDELEGLAEGSRKHLQKLVYTNLVDRFDYMIDKTFISNSMHDNLLDDALKKLDSPVTESDVLKLLMNGDNIHQVVELRVQNVLRNGVLRNRHSLKLEKLFQVFGEESNFKNKRRVNISTGKILASFTPPNNKVPTSICGYADWLYSRRNAVVHGGGNSHISQIDLDQLKKIYNADVVKTTRLKLGAITIASAFYQDVVKLLKSAT
jgi:hypothetical protein